MLNPRRAKAEKDILCAIQEWRQDQTWLVEAGDVHSHALLRLDNGRMEQTILIKMTSSDGMCSLQSLVQGEQLRRPGGGAPRQSL